MLYPAAGFTKGEVIDYYTRIAAGAAAAPAGPAADPDPLPERRRRPVVLREERAGRHARTGCALETPAGARVDARTGRRIDFVVVDDLPTLVWLANLAALELHTPQWKIGGGERPPDLMVVDLDPGAAGRAGRVLRRWPC